MQQSLAERPRVLKTILNVMRFSTRPGRMRVVTKKVLARLGGVYNKEASDEVRRWCAERGRDYADWAAELDPDLWSEASEFAHDLEDNARRRLDATKIQFGGGAAYALLYFLVRKRRPQFVIETGVAAGWSSAAILTAMERNGIGHLWSSDFPYFRQAGAADQIGLLVAPELHKRWTLLIDGDEENLPKIMQQVPRVDLLHFDSDKTYKGRTFAFATVKPKLAEDAIVIFDDVQDNTHFIDIARPDAVVFQERRKYLGILGL